MALRAFASQAATALRISSRPVFLRNFSSKFPEGLKYAKSHEWFKPEGDQGTMGLTSFAVDELGDVVFVELPEVGAKYGQGESICTVESVKASSSVYAPVGGEVVEINSSVKENPENLNKDPFGDSWLVKLKVGDSSQLGSLLSATDYEGLVEKSKH
ncbi:hypothetical protein L7F22_004681 [Adiantum nelumboides]|nr:hypothetical protein [Adiantum nelumboides]